MYATSRAVGVQLVYSVYTVGRPPMCVQRVQMLKVCLQHYIASYNQSGRLTELHRTHSYGYSHPISVPHVLYFIVITISCFRS